MDRQTGLLLGDPDQIDGHFGIEAVAAGKCDTILPPTSAYANLLNDSAVDNAREWVFHHPDDTAVVPEALPDPRQVEITASMPDFRKRTTP